MQATIGRPKNTGGKLANPFEGRSEALPPSNDAASRGYLSMRRSPSGPLTTTRLRTFFGETTMEVASWHLAALRAKGVLTYEALPRGQYVSWQVELLDNAAATDYII